MLNIVTISREVGTGHGMTEEIPARPRVGLVHGFHGKGWKGRRSQHPVILSARGLGTDTGAIIGGTGLTTKTI